MNRRILRAIVLVTLAIAAIILTMRSGQAQTAQPDFNLSNLSRLQTRLPADVSNQLRSTNCALQPGRQPASTTGINSGINPANVTLERFRQTHASKDSASLASSSPLLKQRADYTPTEAIVLIDPTNYGDRYLKDLNGNPAILTPIVVLHETVGSADSAISFFRTPHPDDAEQASYHTLIALDGTIDYLVPPDKRAFGAGNSVFIGANGMESVKTNPDFPPSVNNFAYHISLETPPDGNHNGVRHSGYTDSQYQSLAWLVAKTGVPIDRITTHRAVDRSGSRIDPRSFDTSQFMALLNTYARTTEIAIQCTDPSLLPSS
jgi:hypothetical protein